MTVAQEETWTLDKVMQLTREEMTELWKTLLAPEFRELQGEYEGHVPLWAPMKRLSSRSIRR